MSLQRTLALVKPDAVRKADEIVEAAMQAGFTVLEVRTREIQYLDQNSSLTVVLFLSLFSKQNLLFHYVLVCFHCLCSLRVLYTGVFCFRV